MATKASEVLNPSEARIYIADVGTIVPVDATTAPSASWFDVGHTTEDGLSFSTSPEFDEFKSAQSRGRVVKRIQTADDATVSVSLTQWNAKNLIAAFGGGTVVKVGSTTPAVYKFTPAKLGERKEIALIIDVMEGTRRFRWIFPRCFQTEGVELELNIGATANLPLSLSILAVDDADAFYLLSNDEALNPTAA